MKFTYNWLKQYVDCREHQRPLGEFDWSPQGLAEKLTLTVTLDAGKLGPK